MNKSKTLCACQHVSTLCLAHLYENLHSLCLSLARASLSLDYKPTSDLHKVIYNVMCMVISDGLVLDWKADVNSKIYVHACQHVST